MIVQQMPWRRLYRHEPATQRAWDLTTRGVRDMLIRIPETLDGIVLEYTDDPVEDLVNALSVKPKDRKTAREAIKFLLKDGYLVLDGEVLLIRNFEHAQTGEDPEEESERPTGHAGAPVRSVDPELSAKRRDAGRRGGQRAQATRNVSKQTEQVASNKTEQNLEQKFKQTEQLASSKTEQSASARDPEDQRREEKRSQESPTISETLQVVGRAGGGQANDQANEAKPPELDLKATAELWLRNRAAVEDRLGDCTTWPEMKAVVAAFQETWARPDEPNHGGDARARVIMERFADGCSSERLVDAVRRSKFADYMVEKQSNQRLVVILKTTERVDTFCSLTALPRKAGDREPKQPEGGDWKPNVRRAP